MEGYAILANSIVTQIITSGFGGLPVEKCYSPEFLKGAIKLTGDMTCTVGQRWTGTGFEAYTPPAPDPNVNPDASPTAMERIAAVEQENKQLSAQLVAAKNSNAILEDCLVEMANIVYA